MDLLELTARKPPSDKQAIAPDQRSEVDGSEEAFSLGIANGEAGSQTETAEPEDTARPAANDPQFAFAPGTISDLEESEIVVRPSDPAETEEEESGNAGPPLEEVLTAPKNDQHVFITHNARGEALFTAAPEATKPPPPTGPQSPVVAPAAQPASGVQTSPTESLTSDGPRPQDQARPTQPTDVKPDSVPAAARPGSQTVLSQGSVQNLAAAADGIQQDTEVSLLPQPAPTVSTAGQAGAGPSTSTSLPFPVSVAAQTPAQERRQSRSEGAAGVSLGTNAADGGTEAAEAAKSAGNADKKVVQFLATAGATRPAPMAPSSEMQAATGYQTTLLSTSAPTATTMPANASTAPGAAQFSALVQMPPAMVDRSLLPQIVGAVQTVPSGGTIDLMLDPPELGRIEISLELGENNLRATLSSERASTGDLIRRYSAMLEQHFSDAGFENIDLSFTDQSDGDQQDFSESSSRGPASQTPEALHTSPTNADYRPITGSGRIDVRL